MPSRPDRRRRTCRCPLHRSFLENQARREPSFTASRELTRCGHDIHTVITEGLARSPDSVVWQAAQAAAGFFITQDLDFSDVRAFRPGTHCGLLLVRLREPGANALLEKVSAVAAEIERWQGCFVVLTDYKVRVKRP